VDVHGKIETELKTIAARNQTFKHYSGALWASPNFRRSQTAAITICLESNAARGQLALP
jgi:hypothetical protein